ncbi:unnamed protein product, partial [Musa acuminata subsp. burmannicoides]
IVSATSCQGDGSEGDRDHRWTLEVKHGLTCQGRLCWYYAGQITSEHGLTQDLVPHMIRW